MEGDLIWGAEHTIQYIDDVLYNCVPMTYITLLINVTPINSMKKTEMHSLSKSPVVGCTKIIVTIQYQKDSQNHYVK